MEERMSGMRGVLNYAGCFVEAAGSINKVNGWEVGLRDGYECKLARNMQTVGM